MHRCTRATFLNGPNVGSHFPSSVAILQAAQLQRVAAAINTGLGNVKGPSPLKQALRSASPAAATTNMSPPPPRAKAEEEAAAPAQGTPVRAEPVSPNQPVGTPAGTATPGATRAGRTPGIKRYEPGDSCTGGLTPKKPKPAPVKGATHYKTPSLGPSLGPAFGLGGVPWWCLGGISLGPRLHQGSARLGGALVDGNPPRLSVFVVTFGNKNVTFQNYLNLEGC